MVLKGYGRAYPLPQVCLFHMHGCYGPDLVMNFSRVKLHDNFECLFVALPFVFGLLMNFERTL